MVYSRYCQRMLYASLNLASALFWSVGYARIIKYELFNWKSLGLYLIRNTLSLLRSGSHNLCKALYLVCSTSHLYLCLDIYSKKWNCYSATINKLNHNEIFFNIRKRNSFQYYLRG